MHKIGLEDKQNSKISSLTFSEKKRLNLGETIIHNPVLLIWEEPEQSVDIESHIIIRALLTELLNEGKAILITTSYLADAISITNEVYRLNEQEFKKLDVIDDSGTDAQTDITASTVEDSFGFLGPSGSGKTTIVKILTSQLQHTSGSVQVFGTDVSKLRDSSQLKRIGILTDNSGLYDRLTVYENLELFCKLSKGMKQSISVSDLLSSIMGKL